MKIAFIIHDQDKTVNDFPLGVGYLISALRKIGFPEDDINVINMDVYHHSDEELLRLLEINKFDILCIGMIAGYWQFIQLKRIYSIIDKLKKRPATILGSFMFTPDPEYFMRKFSADYTVLGEGEIAFCNLIESIESNSSKKNIKGIAFWDGNQIKINPPSPPIKDINTIPFPAWDKFPINAYVTKVRIPTDHAQRSMPVITSRGCLYKCTFCYRMIPGYRKRSLDNIMEEVKFLVKTYHLNAICFRDELLMSSPESAMALAERIIKENINIKFDIDGRLNAARPDALRLLKKAGCVYINYGIESLDNNVLEKMNKKQTVDEIISGVEMTISHGIHPGLNVIYGNIGDNEATAKKTVDFLMKYNTHGELRTLKPVTPYPGSELYYTAIKKGLIKDVQDFYENKHKNSDLFTCNFTELSDDKLYDVIFESNKKLIKSYYDYHCEKNISTHKKLYYEKNITFRGVRH